MIRLTHSEAATINEIRSKYEISARQIFEIIERGRCQEGEEITAHIKNCRKRGAGVKEVRIPRNILTRKK